MKLLFDKFEKAPSVFPFHSVGLFKSNSASNVSFSEASKKNMKFPIFNYPTIWESFINDKNDNLYLASTANYYKIGKDIDDFPCLFLEFADLDLRDKNKLFDFINKYGFLNNLKKIKDGHLLSGLDYNSNNPINNKDSTFNDKLVKDFDLIGESFETWLRLQCILRTLIRLWRFLTNKRSNRVSFITKKTLYEEELFSYEDNKLTFLDIQNVLYLATFGHEIPKFYSDYDFIDNKFFKKIFTKALENRIELTELMNNHKPNYNESLIMSQDFIEHFAEEFLREQLNEALHNFSAKTDLSGFVSFRSELAPDGFKFTKNLRCNTLVEAIINQFVNTITEDKSFIRCLECQSWMTTGRKKVERKNYCSNKCRSTAYERRKKLFNSKEILKIITNLSPIDEIKDEIKKQLNKRQDKNKETIFDIFSEVMAPNIRDRNLFNSCLKNIFDNFIADTQKESICAHLGINLDQGSNLMRHHHITSSGLVRLNFTCYWDWDYSQ